MFGKPAAGHGTQQELSDLEQAAGNDALHPANLVTVFEEPYMSIPKQFQGPS